MIRLTTELLTCENEKYHYQGQPFTGIAYALVGEVVESVKEYKDGEFLKNYVNNYLPVAIQSGINSDNLEPENEDDYEPIMCYGGRRFSGVAYDFQNGVCTGELVYDDGYLSASATYYASGIIEAIELICGITLQRYHWHSNGTLKRFEIYEKNIFEITLIFESSGEINCLSINGNYFNRVAQLKNVLKLNLFTEKSFISSLKSALSLYLQGSEITDGIFSELITKRVLRDTAVLHISNTSITDTALLKLTHLPSIKKLVLDTTTVSLETVQQTKNIKNNWEIEFNGSEVK